MTALVPNFRDNLVLEAARIEGEGTRAQVAVRSFDILAFDLAGGRPMPMTLLGLPLPADGSTYVVFNRIDKSRTLLDGTRFEEFKALAAFLHAENERAASWVAGDGPPSPGKGSDSPSPGSAVIGGLANPPPARWK